LHPKKDYICQGIFATSPGGESSCDRQIEMEKVIIEDAESNDAMV
jgi:hypothetical protein